MAVTTYAEVSWERMSNAADKARLRLRDLMDVGLVDESWLKKIPAPLCSRLKELLDSPEG